MCTRPKYAIRSSDLTRDSKQHIKFISAMDRQYFIDKGLDVLQIPCGKCTDCKLQYRRIWALRCMLESLQYESNYFVTLTYDTKYLPDPVPIVHPVTGELIRLVSPLVKSHLQDFMKRLRIQMKRKYNCDNIRFFACGEYGSSSLRCHFHILLFNCPLYDLKFYKKKGNHILYNSSFLDDVWQHKGYVTVSDVCPESCAYVAGYVMKKAKDSDIIGLPPEFTLMSRRPGIGYQYFKDHMEVIYESDTIYNSGFSYRSPRYYDKLLECCSPTLYEKTKENRKRANRPWKERPSEAVNLQKEISQAYIKNSFVNDEFLIDNNGIMLYNTNSGQSEKED